MWCICKIDTICLLSALLFVSSNILVSIYSNQLFGRHHFDYDSMIALDSEFIKDEWSFRDGINYRIEITADIMNSLSWCIFIIPILRCLIANSLHGTRQIGIHVTAAVLVLGGSFMEMMATLFHLGIMNTAQWIASTFNLDQWIQSNGGEVVEDDLGWKTLEIVHTVTRGMLLWVDAFEWLFLSIMFGLLFWSILRQPSNERIFSFSWSIYGLIPGILCLLDFVADLMRYSSWMTYFRVAIGISYINRLFMFPIWLLWLGIQLPKVEQNRMSSSNNATLSSSPLGKNNNNNNNNNTNINHAIDETHSNSNAGDFSDEPLT